MNLRGKRVLLHDMCLRDGMHPKRHQISLEQMANVATALDAAGVPLIEVTHGDGLGGASVNYGFPAHSDEDYLRAVVPRMKQARVSALLIPGIGTVDHLRLAYECGVKTIRVATHCTEADVSEQHIGLARKLGLDTVGFLIMALGLRVLPECRGHLPAAVVFSFAECGPVRLIAKMVVQLFANHAFKHCLVRAARRYVDRQRSGTEAA